jgi:ATP-binding cassette subfamily B protein
MLKRFKPYMGNKAILLPISLVLSAVSAVLSIVPYVLVWLIVRSLVGEEMTMTHVMNYAWLAFGSAVLSVVLYFLSLMSSHLAAFRVEIGMQKVGVKRILDMPIGFFEKYPSGKIRKVVNDGAATTHGFLAHQLPDMAGSVVSPIILFLLLFFVDWRMGLATLVPIALGFFSMSFMMTNKGKAFQQQYYDALEEMSAESVEYVRGIPVVKTFGQSIHAFRRFYNSITRYKEMVYKYTLLWQKPMSFYTVIMQSAVFFLIPTAILLIGRGAQPGQVIVDFVFYVMIAPIFSMLLMKSMHFQQNVMIAKQAIDRLEGLLDYPEMAMAEDTLGVEEANPALGNSIEFRNVAFSYEGAQKPAVNRVSFKVEPGETVALVGASGGGKTTLARLAARFWDVDEGEVLVGDMNVKEIPKEDLMNHIAFVFQNTKLFKTSLRENIHFGRGDIDRNRIDKAIDLSQSREIIQQFPRGMDEVIGTKGVYLSGGERQRISIARAMVKDAPIVLLDEATAFADPENEHLIQNALQALSHGKTTLMIAHRLTSVQHLDRIIVVDQGEVKEQGNHQELLAKGGLYKSMWDEYQQSVAWKLDAVPSVIGG